MIKIKINVFVIILVLCISILFSGCCAGRVRLSSNTTGKDEVRREVEYVEIVRDTVIYIDIPVEMKEVIVRKDTSYLETSMAYSAAMVNAEGDLIHTLSNKPSRLPVEVAVKDTDTKEIVIEERVRTERVEIPVKMPLTFFQKFLILLGGSASVFAIIKIAIFILRR